MLKRYVGPRRSDGDPELRRRSAAYQGVVEAIVALLLCVGAGYFADTRFGSSPKGVAIGTIIGFSAFVLRLFRLRDIWKPEDDDSEEPGAPRRE